MWPYVLKPSFNLVFLKSLLILLLSLMEMNPATDLFAF